MQPTIIIRKEGKRIKINFSYNSDLVDIMRDHNGYYFRKEKAWIFPVEKLYTIKDELTQKMYSVKIISDTKLTKQVGLSLFDK